MEKEITNKKQILDMQFGERMKMDIFEVWRIHNGWIFGNDSGRGVGFVFVPDVLYVEAQTTSHY